jgi:calreticulin
MFGPDVCGSSTKKVHVIFNYKGKNHLIKKDIKCETDQLSHLYTLIVHPDQTYEVRIDNKEKAKGNLLEDWDFLPPKEIPDPSVSKPSDWVDQKEIADPEAKKPEGWDDIPQYIADPEAKKPEDWDDELDGEWEAPMIDNPEYQGEWKAPMIPNPAYKGEWVHPKIANPEYNEDNSIYAYDSNAFVGIEIWQVKSGTIFDDFLVTDDVATATAEAEKFLKKQEAEKKMFDRMEEERKQKEEEERKKREEERKKEEGAAGDLDLDDFDLDEDEEEVNVKEDL